MSETRRWKETIRIHSMQTKSDLYPHPPNQSHPVIILIASNRRTQDLHHRPNSHPEQNQHETVHHHLINLLLHLHPSKLHRNPSGRKRRTKKKR